MLRPPKNFLVPIPIEPLNLENVRFWLHIMQEHALFIKGGLPADRVEDLREANVFYEEFTALRNKAAKSLNDKKFTDLVAETACLVKEFFSFKRYLLHEALVCKLGGCLTPLLLDHLSREAAYFLRLLDKVKEKVNGFRPRQNLFWLQIQQEHTLFIRQRLDPIERTLLQANQEFITELSDLVLSALEYVSMLYQQGPVSAYRRFLKDAKNTVTDLRDFEQAIYCLAKECEVLGLLPPMLADHLRREADHYLMLLSLVDKGNIPCIMEDGEEDIVENRPEPNLPVKQENLKMSCDDTSIVQDTDEDTECSEDDTEFCKEDTECFEDNPDEVEIDEDDDTEIPILQEPSKSTKSKYQWGSNWPRPLGKK